MSQSGAEGDQIIQRRPSYSLAALLAGAADHWSPRFEHGAFATIYLGRTTTTHSHAASGTAAGSLVRAGQAVQLSMPPLAQVPGLFARNERVVLLFQGEAGPFAVILVGALNVGSMDTVWHGNVTPRRPRRIARLPLPQGSALHLARGAELGRFNMGSTVVLLFGKDSVELASGLAPAQTMRLGQSIGRTVAGAAA